MRKNRRASRSRVVGLAALMIAVGTLVGCGAQGGNLDPGKDKSAGGGGDERGATLTIFAAASLTDAFGELANTFEKENPGVKVKTTFSGSSTVLAQIEQGAPADIFASADEVKMDAAKDDGLLVGEPIVFVQNRETVVVPESNPAGIKDWRDLARPGVKLVLAQDEVPAAEYANEILSNADKEYGGDFKQDVLSNVVSREADVRAAVNRVALGDADATFGYTSDVTPNIRDKVKVVEIPQKLNIVANYPIAVLKRSRVQNLGEKWVDLLVSDEGQKVLEKWGFEPTA